jgi:hypothetical protein
MLPILRIFPLGGFLLALLILILALVPPDRFHRAIAPTLITARGPLIDRNEHPEWRQFIIRAALRRADELTRLDSLPDIPVRSGSILPAQDQDPVLLNKPIAELTAEISRASAQAIPPEDGSRTLGYSRAEETGTSNSADTGKGVADAAPLGTAADKDQTRDASALIKASKRHSFIRRGKRRGETEPTRTAAASPVFLDGIFGDSRTPTPRQNRSKRRRSRTGRPLAQGASPAAIGQESTKADREVANDPPAAVTNPPVQPKPLKTARTKSVKKIRRHPQANPSPAKSAPETGSSAG